MGWARGPLGMWACADCGGGGRFLVGMMCALAQSAAADVVVHGDAERAGWQDWSWGGVTRASRKRRRCTPGAPRSASPHTGRLERLQPRHPSPVDVSAYDSLRFGCTAAARAGRASRWSSAAMRLRRARSRRRIMPTRRNVTRVDVPLARPRLTAARSTTSVVQRDAGRAAGVLARRRRVRLGRSRRRPRRRPRHGPALLAVDAGAAAAPSAPTIYGMNFADEELATELRCLCAALRRQRQLTALQLAERAQQPRLRLVLREHSPNDNPRIRHAAWPDGSDGGGSSIRTAGREQRRLLTGRR